MRARVQRDWGEGAAVDRIFQCMVEKLRPDTARHLTAGMFQSMCPGVELPDVKRALTYFAGAPGLLELAIAVLTEYGDLAELDESEVGEFLAQRPIFYLGEQVDPEKTVLYFKATPQLEELLDARDEES